MWKPSHISTTDSENNIKLSGISAILSKITIQLKSRVHSQIQRNFSKDHKIHCSKIREIYSHVTELVENEIQLKYSYYT